MQRLPGVRQPLTMLTERERERESRLLLHSRKTTLHQLVLIKEPAEHVEQVTVLLMTDIIIQININ